MKYKFHYIISIAVFLALVAFSSFVGPQPQHITAEPQYSVFDHDISSVCACQEPSLYPHFPLDVEVPVIPISATQDSFNLSKAGCGDQPCHSCFVCMGWQLFVYMNWPSDPNNAGAPDSSKTAAVFGNPYDNTPLVWETYKNVHDVFSDKKPTPWGTAASERLIDGIDEAGRASFEDHQADNTWLIDKNGNMVFYELFMNEKMFDYIYDNGYYNQQGILSAYRGDSTGISMPNWSCEIKASWMIVPEGQEDTYRPRYKLTKATVPDWKKPGETINVTLALIGLHINEKTPKMPNWAWFTFEHIDNCPDSIQVANNIQTPIHDGKGHEVTDAHGNVLMDNSTLKNSYNLFNPNQPVDQCPNYHEPATRNCQANSFDPVQVARVDPITRIPDEVNDAMHEIIVKNNANSVWQYYQLVNAQWTVKPTKTDPLSNRRLPYGNPRPDFVANTTMETYMQSVNSGGMAHLSPDNNPGMAVRGKSSCIHCHANSATTPEWDKDLPGVDRRTDYFWTDYSAVFFKAQYHKPAAKPVIRKKTTPLKN